MNAYRLHQFPPDIISHAVSLYHRFNLSHRDIEGLLAERGIIVSRESIRLSCNKFGSRFVKRLKRKQRGYGDSFFIEEMFVNINGKLQYLWRAVGQDGDVVDVFIQTKRDELAAKRFLKRFLRRHKSRKIVADKRRSYGVAHRQLMPDVIHNNEQYANIIGASNRLRLSVLASGGCEN